MGIFTARNKQNPFAERRRRERAQRQAEKETAAILADPDTMEAIAEAEAEPVEPSADEAHAAADELTQLGEEIDTETKKDFFVALPVISAETQAKIDAVVNHAIPPADAAKAWANPDPAEIDAQVTRRETVKPEPVGDAKRGRGRPRPQETIDRDNAVHALLVGADAETGISKESIAAELEEKEQQVYSSLRQLTKEGRAETRYVKPHGYRWFALTEGD